MLIVNINQLTHVSGWLQREACSLRLVPRRRSSVQPYLFETPCSRTHLAHRKPYSGQLRDELPMKTMMLAWWTGPHDSNYHTWHWAKAFQSLPNKSFKFALNAAHETLPHNANLNLWWKKTTDTCPLFHENSQNLVHVLNSCVTAKDLRRYNERHDVTLSTIFETIKPLFLKSVSNTVDLDDKYTFNSLPTLCPLISGQAQSSCA